MNYLFAKRCVLKSSYWALYLFSIMSPYLTPFSEIKINMNQNTAQTQCHKSKRPNNQTPNTCAHQAKVSKHKSKQPSTEHMYTCIFGPCAMAHSIWSQSNHHMRSVNFYHTIVHDNESVNETK